jgi:hypothetical protein
MDATVTGAFAPASKLVADAVVQPDWRHVTGLPFDDPGACMSVAARGGARGVGARK